MPLPGMLLVAALTFGACWGLDKLFTRVLRSQAQHRSGTAVRLRKGYAVAGVLLTVLSVMLLVYGIGEGQGLMIFAAVLIGIAALSGGTGLFIVAKENAAIAEQAIAANLLCSLICVVISRIWHYPGLDMVVGGQWSILLAPESDEQYT